MLKPGWHHEVVEVGRTITSFLILMWASSELPSCSCLLARRDDRKRWAKCYKSDSDDCVGAGMGRREHSGRKSADGWEGARGAVQKGAFKKLSGLNELGDPPVNPLEERTALHPRTSRCSLRGAASTAAWAHAYAICWYICSRLVIPLQPLQKRLAKRALKIK